MGPSIEIHELVISLTSFVSLSNSHNLSDPHFQLLNKDSVLCDIAERKMS